MPMRRTMAEHRQMQERVWAERETIRREYEVERLAVDAIGRRHRTSRRQVELVLRRMGIPARPPARRGGTARIQMRGQARALPQVRLAPLL